MAEWDGSSVPEGAEAAMPNSEETGADEPPLTAIKAVELLWQKLPNRHRLFSVWNFPLGLWQEAREEGWIPANLSPQSPLTQEQFRDIYLASRDPYRRWQGVRKFPGVSIEFHNSAIFSWGPPYSISGMIGAEHRVGFSVSDETGPQFRANGGVRYEFSDTSPFGVLIIDDLFWNIRFAEPFTWYRYLQLKLGRFRQSVAFAGETLLDGFQAGLEFGDVQLTLQLGYAGFLNREQTPFVITPSDLTDYLNSQNSWGPPRALSHVSVRYRPSASLQAALSFGLMSDFRDRVTPQRLKKAGDTDYLNYEGGLYSGWMVDLGGIFQPTGGVILEGHVAFQSISSLHFFNDIGQYSPVGGLGVAVDLGVQYVTPVSGLLLFTKVFGASGDGSNRLMYQEGAIWQQATPLSFQFRSWGGSIPLYVLRYDWGNILGGNLGGRYRVDFLHDFTLEAQMGVAARITDGPVSDPQVYVGGDASRFLGAEFYVQAVWNVWAELGLILGLGGAYLNQDRAYPGDFGPLIGQINLQMRFDL